MLCRINLTEKENCYILENQEFNNNTQEKDFHYKKNSDTVIAHVDSTNPSDSAKRLTGSKRSRSRSSPLARLTAAISSTSSKA